ncbi:MAG: response regulator [Anaerolineae bacterium]|nr:response regulator [Anaerolineae bacterium]
MMKIMYVEDNQANISLLRRIARMGGHEVVNYTNGEHALTNFEQDDPDLVLMDLQLEGRISGLDVVKQLRERGIRTPIIAVTAYAMVGDRERCISAGCDSYLSKPLPVAELVELVQNYEHKLDVGGAAAEPAAAPKVESSAQPPVQPPAPVVEAQPLTPDTAPEAASESAPVAVPAAAETVAAESPKAEAVTAESSETASVPAAEAKSEPTAQATPEPVVKEEVKESGQA